MKVKDIRDLSTEDLAIKIHDTREELANLKFQHSLHQLDNSDKVRHVRRSLARMITIQHEVKLGVPEARLTKVRGRE